MTNKEIISKSILLLRFPLIFGVVLLHVDINLTDEYFQWGRNLFRNGLGALCVPLFFFISGYLYFYKGSPFTKDNYIRKTKRRLLSLAIPYIFWNFIFILFVLLLQLYFPVLNSRKPLSEFSIIEYIRCFWDYNGISYDCPIHSHLWFLRELIVVSILSPVVYWFIRKTKGYILFLVAIQYVFNIFPEYPGFLSVSWFYFMLGASFCIMKWDLLKCVSSYSKLLIIVFFALFIIVTSNLKILYIQHLYNIIGVFLIWLFISYQIGKNTSDITSHIIKNISKLSPTSFFIYVSHGFIIAPITRLYCTILPLNTFTGILSFLIIPAAVSSICIIAYYTLMYMMPFMMRIVVGGR